MEPHCFSEYFWWRVDVSDDPIPVTIMTPPQSAELRRLARLDAALTKEAAVQIFRAQATPENIEMVYDAVYEGAIAGDSRMVTIYLDRILGPVEKNVNVKTLSINDMIEKALGLDDED